ncbi:MAG TPA: 4-(cytidine 5'-diphospho)-2-C-methyl-D-erythritol kinase [Acidobacteriota bacterium]|nr:4-(cytidine 5'-diphospho)-2-C-methyl-D-erythritol kinase [Acidobacteriota bacterium]
MSALHLPSFAKINWVLKILGRREDGFHELRTVFQTLDLHDDLTFRPGPEAAARAGVRLRTQGLKVPSDESNLICRAAAALRSAARSPLEVEITLHKRIPLGAGLGGGSSNAAVALLALNRLWDCGLSARDLSRQAAALGSDVPFFLLGGAVAAAGRGEILEPLEDLSFSQPVVLVYPLLHISAAQAYGMRDWGRFEAGPRLTRVRTDTTIQRFCRAAHTRQQLWTVLENDFEEVLYASYPLLQSTRELLEASGCGKVLISGSGSTVAGMTSPDRLQDVVEKLHGVAEGQIFSTRALDRGEYRRRLEPVLRSQDA